MTHDNHKQLISEKDGSDLAGVSAETLRQYRSIGILQGEERNGEVFYSRDELASVFFIRPGHSAGASPAPSSDSASDSPVLSVAATESGIEQPESRHHNVMQTSTDGGRDQESAFSTRSIPIGTVVQPSKKPEAVILDEDPPNQHEPPTQRPVTTTAEAQVTEVENLETKAAEQRFFPLQNISAARIPAAIDQETVQLTRSLRDQIEMLREERDWLRTRLEKLELRYEREQMILLSENDTVRTLISQIGKPKRKWWHALPWFKPEDRR